MDFSHFPYSYFQFSLANTYKSIAFNKVLPVYTSSEFGLMCEMIFDVYVLQSSKILIKGIWKYMQLIWVSNSHNIGKVECNHTLFSSHLNFCT